MVSAELAETPHIVVEINRELGLLLKGRQSCQFFAPGCRYLSSYLRRTFFATDYRLHNSASATSLIFETPIGPQRKSRT